MKSVGTIEVEGSVPSKFGIERWDGSHTNQQINDTQEGGHIGTTLLPMHEKSKEILHEEEH